MHDECCGLKEYCVYFFVIITRQARACRVVDYPGSRVIIHTARFEPANSGLRIIF